MVLKISCHRFKTEQEQQTGNEQHGMMGVENCPADKNDVDDCDPSGYWFSTVVPIGVNERSTIFFRQQVGHLFALRVALGVGSAGVMPAAGALIRDVTHERNIGKAFGATTMLSSLGWAIGPFTGGHLAASMGLRVPFVVTGFALASAAGVVLIALGTSGERASDFEEGEDSAGDVLS